jgi:hypothetical protein
VAHGARLIVSNNFDARIVRACLPVNWKYVVRS